VFVALAWIGGTPVTMSVGKEMKPPPPATAFKAPASSAAMKRAIPYKIEDTPIT